MNRKAFLGEQLNKNLSLIDLFVPILLTSAKICGGDSTHCVSLERLDGRVADRALSRRVAPITNAPY